MLTNEIFEQFDGEHEQEVDLATLKKYFWKYNLSDEELINLWNYMFTVWNQLFDWFVENKNK